MIELQTLGVLDLRTPDGGEVPSVLAQPKRLALLVYLAFANSRRFRRRDTVAALFWPELDQDHARGALRQSLRFLRRALGDAAIVTRGDEIGVDPTVLWCDALAFEAACGAGEPSEALGLYRGDLLDGFHVADAAPELEEWLEQERRRLRALAAAAADQRTVAASAAGDRTAAVTWARRAAELAPYDEERLRRLIVALDASGDRAGALAAYREASLSLSRDLGADPAPETEAFVAAIRSREALPAAPPPAAPENQPSVAEPRPRLSRARRAVAVIAALALLVLAGSVTSHNQSVRALARDRVAVAPLENRTGDPALDPVGLAAADWIIRGLMQTGVVQVMDPRTMLPLGDAAAAQSIRTRRGLAEATGAGTIVSGSYLRSGDSLVFQTEVTDARSGRVLSAVEPVAVVAVRAMDAVDMLRQRLMARLAFLLDPKLGSWAQAASQPPSYEAYREFVEAHELADARRTDEALAKLRRAAALDTSWMVPSLELLSFYDRTGFDAEADSVSAVLKRSRSKLLPLERATLDYWQAVRRADHHGGLLAAREAARLAPESQFAAQHAMAAICEGRPREAVGAMRRLDPRVPWVHAWQGYWMTLALALHLQGDHNRELQVAREARRLDPGLLRYMWLETRALAALGRTTELERRLDESEGIKHVAGSDPEVQWTPEALMQLTADELRAHGHETPALRVYARAERWHDSLAAVEPAESITPRHRLLHLSATGRSAQAESLAATLLAGDTTDVDLHVTLGKLAAIRGDRAAAVRQLAWLAAVRRAPHDPTLTLPRAEIAALLGDKAEAISLVRRSLSEGCTRLSLHLDHELKLLRELPAFQELVRPVEH